MAADASLVRRLPLHAAKAVLATAALVVIGAVLAPGSLAVGALLAILPFVAILGVAAIGQHLVIQQRGLDLSAAGAISLAAVLITALPSAGAGAAQTVAVAALAIASGLVAGAVNGIGVALLRVPPLVTTIGINAVLLGAALLISGGTPRAAPPLLSGFALGRALWLPNTLVIMLVIAALVAGVIGRTAIGRRFIAVGVSPAAARALAIPVERYLIATYIIAGVCYALAGVMLAGFLNVPSLLAGNPYMLATVAAVVVGGNSVAGGRGSVAATIIGAVFLSYLGQLVLSLGFERAMQDIIEAVIVVAGVGLPALTGRQGWR